MFKSLFKPGHGLVSLLPNLASQCAVCHTWPSSQVCVPCIARFSTGQLRCSACAIALSDLSMGTRVQHGLCAGCLRERPSVDTTLVAVDYAYPWSTLITRYKFGDKPGWAPFFAALLLETRGVGQVFSGLEKRDLIIPMPLSAERLHQRGFNQAWELAVALARKSHCNAQLDAQLLLRVKHTQPQTQLRREARLVNVRGAFQLDPLRADLLTGRRVILVDDVMTSGASLFTAAGILRSAGAAHITALAIARTAAP